MAGDDQASTIYTALADVETSIDEGDALQGAPPAAAGDGAAGKAAPGAAGEQAGIPHRWQVVGMMALSFVLCNMDKVRAAWAERVEAREGAASRRRLRVHPQGCSVANMLQSR